MSYGYGIVTYRHCTAFQQVRKSQQADMAFRVLLVGRSHVLAQHLAQKYMNNFRAPFIFDVQGVTGGTDQTSGECSLGQTIPI